MKTEHTIVTNSEKGIDEILAVTEKLGKESGLEKKPVLHLRLIAEELFGMMRGIAGNTESEFRISAEDKKFELHLSAEVDMTDEMRAQFIGASSSGKNSAAKGFTGRIRVLIANTLLSVKEMAPYAMMNTVSAYAGDTASVWTMSNYRNEIMKNIDKTKEANDAWDELEKSVIAKIADDIKVSVIGKKVEITAYKAF